MKRFSILLVVVAFLMPLVVYGLNGNFDRGFFDKGLELDSVNRNESSIKQLSTADEPSLDKVAEHQRMPLFPDPEGIKGTIEAINEQNGTMLLKNASFFNPIKNAMDQADFTIKVQNDTIFYHDTQPVDGWMHLAPGMDAICQGLVNFTTHIVDITQTVYSGRFFDLEEKVYVHLEGIVRAIDRENNTLTFDAISFTSHDIQREAMKVLVSPSTRCLTRKGFANQANRENDGEIPAFVKFGTMVQGVVEITFGQDDATALDLVFFE
jgi:hypothetical protein